MDAPRPSEEDAEDRALALGGDRWTVRAIGATRSGASPDGGARLLLLTFARETAPSEIAEREVLVAAASLADLSQEDLEEAFGRSRVSPGEAARSSGDSHEGETGESVS